MTVLAGSGVHEGLAGFDIPVYHQSGWFDGDGIGSKLNYLGMAAHGHTRQKLVLGPWGHTDTDSRFGESGIDWGPHAVVDLQTSYLRWMDRWLKEIENGIDEEPLVSLFVMGTNDWLHGNTYPLEGTELTKFYLSSAGDTASAQGRARYRESLRARTAPSRTRSFTILVTHAVSPKDATMS